jgi:glutamate 5-kinase
VKGSPSAPVVVKLGGSVLAPGSRARVRSSVVRRLASELRAAPAPLALVHGTGAFGKPPARRHRYLGGVVRDGAGVPVRRIRAALRRMSAEVCAGLRRGGLSAAVVEPAEVFTQVRGRVRRVRTAPLEAAWARGAVPLLRGDMFREPGGWRVLSSDEMACALARALRARRLLAVTDRPGVQDGRGRVIRRLCAAGLRRLLNALPPAPEDVSGGMRGKLERLGRLRGTRRAVIGARTGRLRAALCGRPHGGTELV